MNRLVIKEYPTNVKSHSGPHFKSLMNEQER